MKLRILGCSAGVAPGCHTMAMLADTDILVEAGTGALTLDKAEMAAVRHIFLTHGHLDHMGMVPLLADATLALRTEPLRVYGLPETLAVLRECVFNDRVWPDYTAKRGPAEPPVTLVPLTPGVPCELGGRIVTPLPALHAVPACALCLDSGAGSLVYSSDTTFHPPFWDALARLPRLRHVLVELSYLTGNEEKARRYGHMTPLLLAEGLRRLPPGVKAHVVHMEPGEEDQAMAELAAALDGGEPPGRVRVGEVFEF